MRRRSYWLLTLGLLAWSRIVPVAAGRATCRGLALLALRRRPRERHQAEANLAFALPQWSPTDRDRLLRRSAALLGENLFHTLAAGRLLRRRGFVVDLADPADGDRLLVERLDELLAEGRGLLVLTAHLGCWELAGGWLSARLEALGHGPLAVVTGTVHNPAVDRLLQGRRRNLGLQPLPRERGAGAVIRCLRAGRAVAILQDQHTGTRNLMVPFLGKRAPTPVALAALALRYGVPVLPVAGVWDAGRGSLVMRHLPPIRPGSFAADDQAGFLGRCNEALGVLIRGNPEQWVWFHRRWPEADPAGIAQTATCAGTDETGCR